MKQRRAAIQTPDILSSRREDFLSQGYCYIEDVIPPHEIGAVCDSVERDVRANSALPPPVGYVPGFLRFNQALAPYVASGPVLEFVESFFGPHVRISMFTGMLNEPGIPRGDLHADWPSNQSGAARIPAPYPDCLPHIVTMWMLSDFTGEGGGTIVVPGSHRRPDHPRKDGPIQPVTPYPGETQIAGRAVDRRDIVDRQSAKDSEVPALPRAVFEKLPPEVQRLVHYSVAESAH